MITGTDCTSVSLQFARRFLRLASLADARGHDLVARVHFLTAVKHDPTPASGLEFGRFLIARRSIEDALLVLHDAWNLSRRRRNGREIAECCRSLAIASRTGGDAQQARRWADRAGDAEMTSWSSVDDHFSSAHLRLQSLLALDDRDRNRAHALALAALQVSNQPSDWIASSRHLGRLEAGFGQNHSAASRLLSAARVARDNADHREYAECVFELGHVLRSPGRLFAAASCYRLAAILFEQTGRLLESARAKRWQREASLLARSLSGDPEQN